MGSTAPARLRALTLCCLLVGLLAAAPAAAHDPGAGVPPITEEVRDALGGDVARSKDDLLRVRTEEGASFLTHGPDFPISFDDPMTDHGSDINIGDPERPPVCAANPATDYYQEVLYAYPSSASNAIATERGNIRGIMGRINHVLNEESLASGGTNADYIVRCETGSSDVRVSAVSVASSDTQASFSEIVDAAESAGYANPRADYTIFYDGPGDAGACGVGYFDSDERLLSSNANNNPGGEAGYGASFDGCWYGRTPIHENGHNQGAVQSSAPNSTGSGAHCNQRDDIMCYSPDGGNLLQGGMVACPTVPGTLHFDCGWDSYFDAAPEPGEWLYTHWNIGSPLNRFIRFSSGGNPAPTANFGFSCSDLICTFTDQSSDADGIASRSWSWGDGSANDSGTNPTHEYTSPGTRNVTLTVTDNLGATASITKSVATTVRPVNDDFAAATLLSGWTPPTATEVNVGATKESDEPNHAGNAGGKSIWYRWTAPAPGTVSVNTCGADFDSLLAVYAGQFTPVASDDDNKLCGTPSQQSAVSFNAVGGTQYWIAVDGFDAASGNVQLTLSGTADQSPTGGGTGTGTANQPPTAAFSGSCSQLNCSFSSASTDVDGSIVSQAWSFGDGASGSGAAPTHSYGAANSYPVTLTVTDDSGATDSVTETVTATAPPGGGGAGQVAADVIVPETSILFAPAKTTKRSIEIGFEASEPSTFRCTIDGGGATSCASPLRLIGLSRGSHTFTVAAVDPAGNVDASPAQHRFRVVKKKRKKRRG